MCAGTVLLALAAVMLRPPAARAYYLDAGRTIRLGVRAYVNARVGTENTDKTVVVKEAPPGSRGRSVKVLESMTFPESAAGHLRQNRFFVDAELDHDLTPLLRQGFGPLAVLNHLPFNIRRLRYRAVYRGEGEGIYDWGPREFRARDAYVDLLRDASGRLNPPETCTLESCPDIDAARAEARSRGVSRHRLHQLHVDVAVGRLFLRLGRQNLSWGETDAFRLLDQINPIDASFGGFLIPLDERRVPLDMILARYYLGSPGGRVSEMTVEGFAAIDSAVSYFPGSPAGSPWALVNMGKPNALIQNFTFTPARTFKDIRGGARLLFNAFGVTWSVAHYYTFADIPSVQVCVHPGTGFSGFPVKKLSAQDEILRDRFGGEIPGCPVGPTDLPVTQPPVCGPGPDAVFGTLDDEQPPGCRRQGEFDFLAPVSFTVLKPAKIQVSGATASFTVPARLVRHLGLSGEPVVRTEFAYIKDEPYHRQSQLDPFIFHPFAPPPGRVPLPTAGTLRRDSINFVVGIDLNQFIRPLNPLSSFFISTQFFYKHIKKHDSDAVLPVPAEIRQIPPQADPGRVLSNLGAIEPILVSTDADQFLQTLLISTSYQGGTILPRFTFFYDWSGARVYVPGVTFIHDPFRLTVEWNVLEAGTLKGNSGISLLRDRDNLLFQLEYVI